MEYEKPKNLLKVDPAVAERQTAKLRALKARRDNQKVKKVLSNLREAASTKENLMPLFIDAVKAYATLGEICDTLREVFGEYRQQIVF
jgi:methylmalonyl-CoA mutase N-terminal domain/subunit